jgi:hypothetical protein
MEVLIVRKNKFIAQKKEGDSRAGIALNKPVSALYQ